MLSASIISQDRTIKRCIIPTIRHITLDRARLVRFWPEFGMTGTEITIVEGSTNRIYWSLIGRDSYVGSIPQNAIPVLVTRCYVFICHDTIISNLSTCVISEFYNRGIYQSNHIPYKWRLGEQDSGSLDVSFYRLMFDLAFRLRSSKCIRYKPVSLWLRNIVLL